MRAGRALAYQRRGHQALHLLSGILAGQRRRIGRERGAGCGVSRRVAVLAAQVRQIARHLASFG